MKIEPHVERMMVEADQLADKVSKLATFVTGGVYDTLPEQKQALMSAQLGAMSAYLQILRLRIAGETA